MTAPGILPVRWTRKQFRAAAAAVNLWNAKRDATIQIVADRAGVSRAVAARALSIFVRLGVARTVPPAFDRDPVVYRVDWKR